MAVSDKHFAKAILSQVNAPFSCCDLINYRMTGIVWSMFTQLNTARVCQKKVDNFETAFFTIPFMSLNI
jgi:hypothetical protein